MFIAQHLQLLVTLPSMRIQVLPTPETAAERAADWLRTEIGRASAQRGRCLIALSGGRTPWRMLRDLRGLHVHWHDLQVFQVDERVVPENDERRNARQIADLLIAPTALHAAQFHAMPVERSDLAAGAQEYARLLTEHGGTPPVLDVVQLGLGGDGHTASLVPGDRLLEARDHDVGVSVPYQGVARMTLTFRVLDAARHRLWLVTGAEKAAALRTLWAGDASVPAGHDAPHCAYLCAAPRSPDYRIVCSIAPSFGAILLEDISAPRCFEIEQKLRARLSMPVLHDDQQATAVVVLAALLNATRQIGAKLDPLTVGVVRLGVRRVWASRACARERADLRMRCGSQPPVRSPPPRPPDSFYPTRWSPQFMSVSRRPFRRWSSTRVRHRSKAGAARSAQRNDPSTERLSKPAPAGRSAASSHPAQLFFDVFAMKSASTGSTAAL